MKLSRFLRAKTRQASTPSAPQARQEGRIPPGQRVVEHFPVLDLGLRPRIPLAEWSLKVEGAVEHPLQLSWQDFMAFPQVERITDIHCVTRWSKLDVTWEGVPVRAILERAKPFPEAAFALVESHDDYAANLPLEVLMEEDVLFAHRLEGEPLSREHGGPVRLVVPKRYFWKSAKWVRAIRILKADQRGFWEQRGYHNRGDPWREERFGY